MIQPIGGIRTLGANAGSFVRRAVYICRADVCTHCGKCMKNCPIQAIFIHQGHPVIDPCLCIDCGLCQRGCPADAILRTVQLTKG